MTGHPADHLPTWETNMLIRLAALAAGTALALGALAGTASAADPIGPTGTGPKTTVVGDYLLVDGQGVVRELGHAAVETDLTVPAYWTVTVSGAGSWCIVPTTREQHNGADDHEADCYSAPDVSPAWARGLAVGQ